MTDASFDRSRLKTASLRNRCSKVEASDLWRQWDGTSAAGFAASLPGVLAAGSARELASAILSARSSGSERLLMYGGHVIKCGLGPLLCHWMGEGVLSSLATNGAGSIHDLEMALFGRTSEDVEAGLRDGSFGMWEETADIYAQAVDRAESEGAGLGEALGRVILERGGDPATSPLAAGAEAGVPVSVHPALGTDIVHPIARVDWGRLARAAERDFDMLGGRIGRLSGGVVINAGSAVVMPEVFLKLLSCARNLGFEVSGFTAANLDMIQHYRPGVNVLARPVSALGGRAIAITGHHELVLPLLDLLVRVGQEVGR
jgi:hypothetical protein